MTKEEIEAEFTHVDSYWEESFCTADAFCEEMADKSYGHDELLDAWLWFVAGWNARESL